MFRFILNCVFVVKITTFLLQVTKKVVPLQPIPKVINRKYTDKMEKTKKSELKAQIAAIEVGHTAYFPIERFTVVRVYCTELGYKYGFIYKTHNNRNTRKIEVTRTA